MNKYVYVVIGLSVVIVGILLVLIFVFNQQSTGITPVSSGTRPFIPSSDHTQLLVGGHNAILLAENDPHVISILERGGYHYDGVYWCYGYGLNDYHKLTKVNVDFQAVNGSGLLIVVEDPQMTKILKIGYQVGIEYQSQCKNP